MAEKQEDYRALVGMNYTNESGNEVRVEAGDKLDGMPDNEVRAQVKAGNAESWVPRQTENVQDPDGDTEVHGVQSRHTNGGDDIVLKEVTE